MAQDYNLWQKLLNASDKLGDATLGKWFPLANRETNFQKAVSQAQQESGGNLTAIRKANPMVYKAILDNKITPDQGREIVTKGFVQAWKDAKTAEQNAKNSTSNQSILGTSNTNNTNSTGLPDYLSSLAQISGKTANPNMVANQDEINTYIKNAKKWASTTQPNAKVYPYRQPETVKDNAEYVGKYIDAVMNLAPYFNLPPKTVAAMIMNESGWGGQRFNGNLGGYGFISTKNGGVKDLGIRFNSDNVYEQAAQFLDKLSSDWNGRYQNSTSPEDFVKKGYNSANPNYSKDVYNVMGMLEAK